MAAVVSRPTSATEPHGARPRAPVGGAGASMRRFARTAGPGLAFGHASRRRAWSGFAPPGLVQPAEPVRQAVADQRLDALHAEMARRSPCLDTRLARKMP